MRRRWWKLGRRHGAVRPELPIEPAPQPIDDGTDATYAVLRMGRPAWDGPTATLRPLLTRGQAARSAGTASDTRWSR